MSFYERAEGIILKYLHFLKEQNALKDHTINRGDARSLYMGEFKSQNRIVNFSFSKMYRVMLEYGLILRKSKGTDFIYFKAVMFDYCMRYYTKSDLKGDNNVAVSPSTTNNNQKLRCNICDVVFSNTNLLQKHQRSERHLQKQKIAKEEQSPTFSDVIIEVETGHGRTPETICLRQNESKDISLNIINNSVYDYKLQELSERNRSSSVVLKKLDMTQSLLAAKSKVYVELHVQFQSSTYHTYTFGFKIKNMSNGVCVNVAKELIFQVQSKLVDDLQPTRPFQRQSPANIRNVGCEIVPGVPPSDPTPTRYRPKIKLEQYPLPQHMVVLLDNDLTEFTSMTEEEKRKLLHIRNDYSYYKKIGTLDQKNYYSMNQLRLYMEEYQMKIDIHSYDVDNQELHPVKNYPKYCYELYVPGLAEHRPSVLRGDSVFIQEHRDSKFKYEGIVHKVNQSSVILGMSYLFADKIYIKKNKYAVSFNFSRLPIRVEQQANKLANKHNVISLLLPEVIKPNPLSFKKFAWYNSDIAKNEKQQEAVKHIVSATAHPAPYLIFGPPGTGKTVTVVEAILQVRKLKSDQKVLVSAPSNSAADEITKRLIKHVPKKDLFRYVAPSHPYDLIDVSIKPYTNYKDEFYHPDMNELLKYHIIVTTLVTAYRLVNGGTPPHHFSYVFIDESGQATETETLIPIMGILTNNTTPGSVNGQIVLAGDPEQLGPVIHSQRASDVGYGMSMLERIMKHSLPYKRVNNSYDSNVLTKLVNSYRSHAAILAQPNELFYYGELIPPKNQDLINIALGWEKLPNKDFPVIFHSVQGKDQREDTSPSFFNLQEVDVVVQYLQKLIGCKMRGMKIQQSHIGVITPYRKQVHKIQLACRKLKCDQLSVGSVEQFQGQERLIIIVSTVRSDPKFTAKDVKFHLGFLRNPKRMNVALTRAKALLIIVGNPNLLQLDDNWRSFIKYCKDNNAVAGTPFNIFEPSALENSLPHINDVTTTIIDEESVNFSRGNI